MPSIEITAEQAAALARGESITVADEPLRVLICTSSSTGAVYEVHMRGKSIEKVVRLRRSIYALDARLGVVDASYRKLYGPAWDRWLASPLTHIVDITATLPR